MNGVNLPGEKGSTITSILSSSTGFGVGFPIGLNGVDLGAFLTLPFLLTMFPAVVFLDSGEIAQRPRRVVVETRRLRAHVRPLPILFAAPLLQLPWQIVPPPVKLQVLISLKTLVADLTHKSVCRH